MKTALKKLLICVSSAFIPEKIRRHTYKNTMYCKYIRIDKNSRTREIDPELGYIDKRTSNAELLEFVRYLNMSKGVKLSILDIGAREGLRNAIFKDMRKLDNTYIVGVEPEPKACRDLLTEKYGPYDKTYCVAIGQKKEQRTLYLTNHYGCSSVLEPDIEMFKKNKLSNINWFKVEKTIEVKTVTLRELFPTECFDFIKVDVQGLDYEVITSASDKLMANAIGVSMEVQIVPFYKGQKKYYQLIEMMQSKGYWLLTFELGSHSWPLDGLDWEGDVHFIKAPDTITTKEEFFKHCLYALLCEKSNYVSFLVRNYGDKFMSRSELMKLVNILKLQNWQKEFLLPVYRDS